MAITSSHSAPALTPLIPIFLLIYASADPVYAPAASALAASPAAEEGKTENDGAFEELGDTAPSDPSAIAAEGFRSWNDTENSPALPEPFSEPAESSKEAKGSEVPPSPPLLHVLLTTAVSKETTPHTTTLAPYRRLPPGAISGVGITVVPPWLPPLHHRGHHHGGTSRFGPYFEEGAEGSNVTARLGSTVRLDCKIGMLQDKTVTWLHRKSDAIHLLTVGRQAYSSDSRFSLAYRYPNNWRLQILFVTRRDEGLYECQVATHPPRVRQVFLRVTAPELKIVDENHHEVLERYYKAGSEVELRCLASQLEEDDGVEKSVDGDHKGTTTPISIPSSRKGVAGRVLWRHGDSAITHNTSGRAIGVNVSADGRNVAVTLTLKAVKKEDGGNYTCSVGVISSAAVSIHILNGELPAAVQYGKSTMPFEAASIWLQLCCLALSCSVIFR